MERCVLESGSHCEIRAALMAGTLGTLIFASMALLRKKNQWFSGEYKSVFVTILGRSTGSHEGCRSTAVGNLCQAVML